MAFEILDLTFFFLSGLYIALSPCLFPIMPLTIFRIMNKKIIDETGVETVPTRKMALQWVILLTSGIVLTFSIAIILITYIGVLFSQFLYNNYAIFSFILGIILLILGLVLLFPVLGEKSFAKIPIPQKVTNFFQREEYGALDLFLLGLGYSFIAFPCASPVFLSLPIVGVGNNPFYIILGMILFALGVFIPYLVLVFVTAEARIRAAQYLAEKFRYIEIIVGILMIIVSLTLMQTQITTWLLAL
ncbi:MAG: cytochrome c biogenesis protein CcdA [Candidatus Hodarchaeales archaeon]